ncbi:hypothetical protein [Brevundimonas sp.]|uniref:hypothetical protein n=1 Tax=Brevundimonas sp. TaxID=1871086 RepID=UPI0035B403CA
MTGELPDLAGVSRALVAAHEDRRTWLEVEKAAATAHGVIKELERVEEAVNIAGHGVVALHETFTAVFQRRAQVGRRNLADYASFSDLTLRNIPDDPSPELAQIYLANLALLKMQGDLMALNDHLELIEDIGIFIAFASGVVVLSDRDDAALSAAIESLLQALKDEVTSKALGPLGWVKIIVEAVTAARRAEVERRRAMNDHMARYEAIHDTTMQWAAATLAFTDARRAALEVPETGSAMGPPSESPD